MLIGVAVSLVVGFLIGSASSNLGKGGGIANLANLTQNDLYTSQSATVQGKITKVEGKMLTVTNSSGKSGELELSDNAIINKIKTGGRAINTATSSTDLTALETDKDVTLFLQMTDGKYKVISVNYTPPLPPVPTLPPVPKK
ncbi:MAG: hypothetical protein US19_C0034G0011 [Candidatus Daviesbacteria bacterium GW2011_GWB1_36_5]|uniref:DUF5666 domain-containing protein n=1 Tax=Candidatus Daviesbacteria bacterium GW2011_GWB1_36_5 TaxID=1618426 RepID=A0A0G0F2V4_9BACT|nr:MAG: hypothetical protein US19_C0034G0011 [Candidatus Daviesbacteria bacterium GW2011_GWB1_36_5]